MATKTKKKKKRPIKSTAEVQKEEESGKGIEEIAKEVQEGGLRLSWINFIEAYIANGGNGTKAYQIAFSTEDKKISENVARASAPRLLANVSIREEINNRLNAQKVTEERLVNDALDYVNQGKYNEKYAMAGAKMIETLMKTKGMLVDTKKVEFTGENPAIFPALVSAENKEKFDKMVKDKQRIAE